MDTSATRRRRPNRGDQGSGASTSRSKIVDRAIQVHGAAGVTDDFPLAMTYANLRTLRLADGPDEVHSARSRAANCASTDDLRPEGLTRWHVIGESASTWTAGRRSSPVHPGGSAWPRREHWPPPAPTSS